MLNVTTLAAEAFGPALMDHVVGDPLASQLVRQGAWKAA